MVRWAVVVKLKNGQHVVFSRNHTTKASAARWIHGFNRERGGYELTLSAIKESEVVEFKPRPVRLAPRQGRC